MQKLGDILVLIAQRENYIKFEPKMSHDLIFFWKRCNFGRVLHSGCWLAFQKYFSHGSKNRDSHSCEAAHRTAKLQKNASEVACSAPNWAAAGSRGRDPCEDWGLGGRGPRKILKEIAHFTDFWAINSPAYETAILSNIDTKHNKYNILISKIIVTICS